MLRIQIDIKFTRETYHLMEGCKFGCAFNCGIFQGIFFLSLINSKSKNKPKRKSGKYLYLKVKSCLCYSCRYSYYPRAIVFISAMLAWCWVKQQFFSDIAKMCSYIRFLKFDKVICVRFQIYLVSLVVRRSE